MSLSFSPRPVVAAVLVVAAKRFVAITAADCQTLEMLLYTAYKGYFVHQCDYFSFYDG
jgi:hypothetical protein